MNSLIDLLSLSFLILTVLITIYFLYAQKRTNELHLLKINADEKMSKKEEKEYETKLERINSIAFWAKVVLYLPIIFLIGYFGL